MRCPKNFDKCESNHWSMWTLFVPCYTELQLCQKQPMAMKTYNCSLSFVHTSLFMIVNFVPSTRNGVEKFPVNLTKKSKSNVEIIKKCGLRGTLDLGPTAGKISWNFSGFDHCLSEFWCIAEDLRGSGVREIFELMLRVLPVCFASTQEVNSSIRKTSRDCAPRCGQKNDFPPVILIICTKTGIPRRVVCGAHCATRVVTLHPRTVRAWRSIMRKKSLEYDSKHYFCRRMLCLLSLRPTCGS